MKHSVPCRFLLPLALHLAPSAPADDLQLAGDHRLSGTVTAIRADGAVLVQSPFAAAPLALKSDAVRRVLFSAAAGQAGPTPAVSALLHLRNGDLLPGSVLSINEKTVVFTTGDTGRLEVPRAMVLGVAQGREAAAQIYPGPDGPGSWQADGSGDNEWEHNGGVLSIRGKGVTGQKIAGLTERFIVKFKLSWTGQPNLRFSFAGDEFLSDGVPNRYYFEFTSAGGIAIKREASFGERYTDLIRLNRLPAQFENREVQVEIRADRSEREIQLLLNGEIEGRFKDAAAKAPAGKWLVFQSYAGDDCVTRISDLAVSTWDGSSSRAAVAIPAAGDGDTLTGVDGERFTGVLTSVEKVGGALIYRFRCADSGKAIEVPESAVASMVLARPPGQVKEDSATPFQIRLGSGGMLGVQSAEFAGDIVTVVHPLLGKLQFKRAAIKAFERPVVEKAPAKPES